MTKKYFLYGIKCLGIVLVVLSEELGELERCPPLACMGGCVSITDDSCSKLF